VKPKNSIIEIAELHVKRNNNNILQNINISISQNDFLIIFGEDNSGKTTLLSALLGLITPKAGTIQLYGKDTKSFFTASSLICEAIRLVPDDILIEPNMTGDMYFVSQHQNSPNYDISLENKLCEKYHIDKNVPLLDMTYQQNKLTSIVAAICAMPQILILDEPYNFLEKGVMNSLLEDLNSLNQKGMCIIITTEKYEHAMGYGSRYVYLVDGQIQKSDTVPQPDYRIKAVTVPHHCIPENDILLNDIIATHRNTITYKYAGDIQTLFLHLKEFACPDATIENISLEEEIRNDFSRWN